MNNLQWTILFLIAFAATGMIWYAKTYVPEINLEPNAAYASSQPQTQLDSNPTAPHDGPRVIIIGSKKAQVVPVVKQSFVAASKVDLNNINSFRAENGRRILVFNDGSKSYLSDQDYQQLPAGVRLRFEYRQGQP